MRASYDFNILVYADDCGDENLIEPRQTKDAVDFAIYPNPAKQDITITLDNNDVVEFEIINSTGAVIELIKVKGSKHINLNNYTEGIYFLIDKSGKLPTQKFTVIK